MTLKRTSLKNDAVGPEKLSRSVRTGRYLFDTFQNDILCSQGGAQAGNFTELAGSSLAQVRLDSGSYVYEFAYLGDATAAFVPSLASEGGLNFGTLQTDGLIGAELNIGGVKDFHPRNFRAATTGSTFGEDWFVRALFNVNNWSGVDITLGFKKATATYVATLTEVVDIFGIRALGDSSSALAALSAVYNQNNNGTTDYTTTAIDTGSLTDATTVELEVRGVAGKLQLYVNGVRVLGGLSVSFDAGDIFSPIIRMMQTTDLATQVKVLAIEAGPLEDRQDGSLGSLGASTT